MEKGEKKSGESFAEAVKGIASSEVTCPHHKQPLQVETEKRMVHIRNEDGTEGPLKEITVRYAVCKCVAPGGNPFRGRRVWEQT